MRSLILWVAVLTIGSLLVAPASAAPGATTLVSISSAGVRGNQFSGLPVISADGRFVAFVSRASNLVPGDTNGGEDPFSGEDVFVHDRRTGDTTVVSVNSKGALGNADSSFVRPAISANGRFIAFSSFASNLVPGDTNAAVDVFVHDRRTGDTTRLSVDSDGRQPDSGGPGGDFDVAPLDMTDDGDFVAFASFATNLVSGDTNAAQDVFIHDRRTGDTTRVSVNSNGAQGNADSHDSAISSDGRFVAFASEASNLVRGDTNGIGDVFVHDRQTGATSRVSVNSKGAQGNDDSGSPAISRDGRFVTFQSRASNLVRGDTNGSYDVFVHDRSTGATTRVSVDSAGNEGDLDSDVSAISDNGRFVAFASDASNLVPSDTNGSYDVFVHDRSTGATTRVSVDSAGNEGDLGGYYPADISADGRFVSFPSDATNLVPEDSNRESDVFVHDRGPDAPGK